MSRVRIIGIGSPFGDDRIGWQAIDHLIEAGFAARFPPDWVSFEKADRPGGLLISLIRDAELAVLVDAMRSGAVPGTLRRLCPDELVPECGLLSGHALGVADTLALAEVLGDLPRRVVIYGIEMGASGEACLQPGRSALQCSAFSALDRRLADDIAQIL